MFEPELYTGAVSKTAFLVSDHYFNAKTMLKAVQLYAFEASPYFHFYLINRDNVVIFHKIVSVEIGYNYIPIMITLTEDTTFGVYGQTFKSYLVYAKNNNPDDYTFSTGYIEGDIKPAEVGDVLTLNTYSTNLIVSFPISIVYKASGDYQAEEQAQIEAKTYVTEPMLLPGGNTKYPTHVDNRIFIVSDKVIPFGSFIKSVRVVMTSGSENIYLYIIDKDNNIVKERIRTTSSAGGTLEIPVNCFVDFNAVIGLYGHNINAKENVSDKYAFSNGYIVVEATHTPARINDTLVITSNNSVGNIALPIQWDYYKTDYNHIDGASEKIQIYNSINHSAHSCIACFIDDDSGQYVPDVWGEILTERQILMGFACITGYMSGEASPINPKYYQMPLKALTELYNKGHEIYSHSFTHPAFYESSNNTIIEQCYKSKDWLFKNGFARGANIIIYPGGLGYSKLAQQTIIKRYYKYGVEATGDGINSDISISYNRFTIARINADTSTIAELKSAVDAAYAQNKIIVFMNHAYELNLDRNNQVAKMIDLIDYILNKGINIMPLEAALNQTFGI